MRSTAPKMSFRVDFQHKKTLEGIIPVSYLSIAHWWCCWYRGWWCLYHTSLHVVHLGDVSDGILELVLLAADGGWAHDPGGGANLWHAHLWLGSPARRGANNRGAVAHWGKLGILHLGILHHAVEPGRLHWASAAHHCLNILSGLRFK